MAGLKQSGFLLDAAGRRLARLSKLGELRDRGILTEVGFEAEKDLLLKRDSPED